MGCLGSVNFILFHTSQVDEITSQVDEITRQVDEITSQVDEITSQVDEITSQVDEITSQVDEITSQVDEIWSFQQVLMNWLLSLSAEPILGIYIIYAHVIDSILMYIWN